MAWELMNEPRCTSDPLELFTTPQRKALNPGFDIGTDFIANNRIPGIDFATAHSYPDQWAVVIFNLFALPSLRMLQLYAIRVELLEHQRRCVVTWKLHRKCCRHDSVTQIFCHRRLDLNCGCFLGQRTEAAVKEGLPKSSVSQSYISKVVNFATLIFFCLFLDQNLLTLRIGSQVMYMSLQHWIQVMNLDFLIMKKAILPE